MARTQEIEQWLRDSVGEAELKALWDIRARQKERLGEQPGPEPDFAALKDRPQVGFAASDADFRQYLRAAYAPGLSLIAMDADPEKMSVAPFLRVGRLFSAMHVPRVVAADEKRGFVAMEDLGPATYLAAFKQVESPAASRALLLELAFELAKLQSSGPQGSLNEPEKLGDALPLYSLEKLDAEMELFVDWYLGKRLGVELNAEQRRAWDETKRTLLRRISALPYVYCHRDYIARNAMIQVGDRPGIIDFQDAVFGPLHYDLASLLRDAFVSWDEETILDVAIRYWEKARGCGLPVEPRFEDFYKNMEWVGVQRHLKVAGIFCRLNRRDGKDGYEQDTPRFLGYLMQTSRRYGELRPLLNLIKEVAGPDLGESKTFLTF